MKAQNIFKILFLVNLVGLYISVAYSLKGMGALCGAVALVSAFALAAVSDFNH